MSYDPYQANEAQLPTHGDIFAYGRGYEAGYQGPDKYPHSHTEMNNREFYRGWCEGDARRRREAEEGAS